MRFEEGEPFGQVESLVGVRKKEMVTIAELYNYVSAGHKASTC